MQKHAVSEAKFILQIILLCRCVAILKFTLNQLFKESLKKLIDAEINPHCAEWEAAGAYPAHEGQYHNELLTKLIND